MTSLRLRLLGSPLVWRDEQPVRFKTRKTLAALVYLVVEGGMGSREQLAALLWPDQDLADARKNLRTMLSYMYLALGDDGVIVATHDTVSLDPSALVSMDLDLQVLARTQRLARAADGDGGGELRVQLEQAVALYRGPFLAGLDIPAVPEFETWLAGQRAHWLGVVGELLERLARLQAAGGDLGAARETIERWVALEPGEERAWQQLLSLALEAGDLVGARRSWATCQDALNDLGVEPGEPLQILAQQIDAAAHIARPWPLAETSQESTRGGGLGQAPLVGRAGPLATLRRAFARVQTGRTQLVVLQGEAGIGKTRLAGEFLAWSREQGADVLVGRGFEAEGRLPYASLVGGLRSRLERENAPDDLLSDLWLAELARLLPELRERYPDLPHTTEDGTLGQGRLYEAVAQLGQALAARRPLVLFLDDAQWMDAATRDLVRYIVQRWTENEVRILVLLAVRVDGSGQQQAIDQWLHRLEGGTATTWLDLERLTDEEVVYLVAALAGDTPDGEQADLRREQVTAFGQWLAVKCNGVPFLQIRMLQALLDEGVLQLCPVPRSGWALDVKGALQAVCTQRGDLLPEGVRALVTAQVAHLEETAATLLAVGAVLGESFSAERLLQVAAVEERSGEDALDQLVRGKLLREVPETGEYSVGHTLVREVLYAELGMARRRRLHRRAMEVLAAEDAPAVELQRHALAAGLVAPSASGRVLAGDAAPMVPAATTTTVREAPAGLIIAGARVASTPVAYAEPARGQQIAPCACSDAGVADSNLRPDKPRYEVQQATRRGPRHSHAAGWYQRPNHLPHQSVWHHLLADGLQLGVLARQSAGTSIRRERREQHCEAPIAHGEQRRASLTRPPPRGRQGTRRKPSC
jgi:DNA-binding SARP family transcriptional activator